ncbi:BURP domain-containing protein BNM2A [Trifolium repens]|nr:BURP domain-containing protein BNM2A [Trifolium repens]
MAINIVSWMLLHLLVVIMLCSHGFQARELVETENKSLEIHHNHHHNHMTHNIDPSLMVLLCTKSPKIVACHTVPYPHAVFYCHSQESENRVYKVLLGGENGDKVEAMVVCHMDTSQWAPSHVSFQVLGVTPGSSSVCHFFPADNYIWVPKLKSQGSSSM